LTASLLQHGLISDEQNEKLLQSLPLDLFEQVAKIIGYRMTKEKDCLRLLHIIKYVG